MRYKRVFYALGKPRPHRRAPRGIKQILQLHIQRNASGQIIGVCMLIDGQHVPERCSIAVSRCVEVAQLLNQALGGIFKFPLAPGKWSNLRAHCCDGVDIGCRNQHLPREVGFSRKMIRWGGAGGVRHIASDRRMGRTPEDGGREQGERRT